MVSGLRTGLEGVAKLARILVVPACLAMLFAKFASVWAVSRTAAGAAQLSAEVGVRSVAAWLAADLGAGILWAAVVAVVLGWRYQRPTVLRFAPLALLGLALALFLTISIEVVRLYALQPQLALLAALSRPTEAADSMRSLLSPRVAFNFAVLAIVLVAGPFAVARISTAVERHSLRIGVMCGAMVAVTFLLANTTHPSALELDRNPVLRALGSIGNTAIAHPTPAPTGSFAAALAPTDKGSKPAADVAAYNKLRAWALERKPNVVLVILESTSPAHMGAFGAAVDNTPKMAAFAKRGIVWPNHFAHAPNSMFAIYSILGSNHGTPFGKQITQTRPRIAVDSLPEVLTRNGYVSGLFHSSHFTFYDKDQFLAGRGYDVLLDATSFPNRSEFRDGSWGIEEHAALDAMLGWARAKGDQSNPLFITYIPFTPHHPYSVMKSSYYKKFGAGQVGRYRSALHYMDAVLGELAQHLQRDLTRPTLYLFVSDHGEGFGEHPGSFMHGLNLYEEGVRSFVVIYSPDTDLGGYRDRRNFGHVDVAPTLQDILGLGESSAHAGVSARSLAPRQLVPIYTGKTAKRIAGVVDGQWKYFVNFANDKRALYDLASDPGEKKNLASVQAALTHNYHQRTLQFISEQKAWESSLPDVEEAPAMALAHKRGTVILKAADCNLKPAHVTQGAMVGVSRAGTHTAQCAAPAAGPGRVVSLKVTGVEAIAGAQILVAVVWNGPSENRPIVRCVINGSGNKPANGCLQEPATALATFGEGGVFEVELRFIGGNETPLAQFHIENVALEVATFD